MTHHPLRLRARAYRRLSHMRGVSLIEFVIVFPLATLFVLGLIQTGMVYMAKLTLNNATFMAARQGSLHNANLDIIENELLRNTSPFYQDSTETNFAKRVAKAKLAYEKTYLDLDHLMLARPKVEILNPSPEAFTDFGLKDSKAGVTYIPNDNLEHRSLTVGTKSNLNIRDANLLKIRVVYPYELKVPLMAGVVTRVMCGGTIGVEAYGNVSFWQALFGPASQECLRYYSMGFIPIETFAIIEMQSRAEKKS